MILDTLIIIILLYNCWILLTINNNIVEIYRNENTKPKSMLYDGSRKPYDPKSPKEGAD